MKKKQVKIATVLVIGIAFLGIIAEILFTPNFVANHLSPDGVLEKETVNKVQLVRIFLLASGGTTLLLGFLAFIRPSLLKPLYNMAIRLTKNYIKKALDFDWSAPRSWFILIPIYIASRPPLLIQGFGLDPDAWRIAESAFDFRHTLSYHPSSFPGYPLPEIFNSIVINWGSVATNSLTALLTLMSIIAFAKILKVLECKNSGLLLLTYTFMPLIWINSANTMDYMWGLSFLVITWYLIRVAERYPLAGFTMGLAVGSRLTDIVLAVPFIYLIWATSEKRKTALYFSIILGATIGVFFLPLLLNYGFRFLTYYPSPTSLGRVIADINRGFGSLAYHFIVILVPFSMFKLGKALFLKNKEVIFALSTVILTLVLYIKAPYEVEYLIPIIPFGIFLMSKIHRRGIVVALCIILVLPSITGISISIPILKPGEGFGVSLKRGAIVENLSSRKKRNDHIQRIVDTEFRKRSIVVLLWWNNLVTVREKLTGNFDSRKANDINYSYPGLSLESLKQKKSRGYKIYYADFMRDRIQEEFNCLSQLIFAEK